MKMSLASRGDRDDSNREELHDALSSREGAGNNFAILERDKEEHYMQVAGTSEEGFIVEYRSGGMNSHYRCEERISLEEALDTLERYAERDRRWRTDLNWKEVDLGPSEWNKCLNVISLTIIVIGIFLFWNGSVGKKDIW